MSGAKVEVGESMEADFEKMTWTFHFDGYYTVSAGKFAILPVEQHEEDAKRLDWATRILRSLCDTENEKTVGPRNYEAILRFFDPKP